MDTYPATAAARDRFVLDRRGHRQPHDPWRSQQLTVEDERIGNGRISRTATVFLTGRECPWRCVMCDLWRFTIAEDTPEGATAAQIRAARASLESQGETIHQMKLYNAGNFFDPRAVPPGDYREIATHLRGLDRVVVESHPTLIGGQVDRFVAALDQSATDHAPAGLEVAMGLETSHPVALERLHKRMTVETFAAASEQLARREVAIRVFLLISPPFIPAAEQQRWLMQSIETAFACQAGVVSLVPTRSGNGAIDALAAEGLFDPPDLDTIEQSFALALANHPGQDRRIFLDLWDLDAFAGCRDCLPARRARLHAMNLEQRVIPPAVCPQCG